MDTPPGIRVPVLIFESQTLRIVAVNEATAAAFNTRAELMLGRSVESCLAPEERSRLLRILGTTEPRWGDVGQWRCIAHDGSSFVAQIRFHQSIREGVPVHIVIATTVQLSAGQELQKASAAAVGARRE